MQQHAPATIDLRSDTKTRPTAAMRRAIAEAEVGDDQSGEDPTCRLLCERVADLLGKESAIFLPSGTMCNQIAMRIHCRAGDAVLCAADAHVHTAEAGGMAGIAGASVQFIPSERGIFAPQQVNQAITALQKHNTPLARLLVIEQTTNYGGGSVWSLQGVQHVAAAAKALGLAVHMDGARLLNAVVASKVPARDYAAACDSVWIDFTKGLGAPIGAVLAGERDFIAQAVRFRQMMGGALRQAGIAAAGCLYALEYHVQRLATDHANAKLLAAAVHASGSLRTVYDAPETNIVLFTSADGTRTDEEIVQTLARSGILTGTIYGGQKVRAVTHLDISQDAINRACEVIARL